MNISGARRHILDAVTTGVISGVMTLILTLGSIVGIKVLGFSVWNLIDVALVFGFTYGIYKNSRICAVLMLIYFTVNQIFFAVTISKPPSFLSCMFIYFFFQGTRATFAYHRLLQEKSAIHM